MNDSDPLPSCSPPVPHLSLWPLLDPSSRPGPRRSSIAKGRACSGIWGSPSCRTSSRPAPAPLSCFVIELKTLLHTLEFQIFLNLPLISNKLPEPLSWEEASKSPVQLLPPVLVLWQDLQPLPGNVPCLLPYLSSKKLLLKQVSGIPACDLSVTV